MDKNSKLWALGSLQFWGEGSSLQRSGTCSGKNDPIISSLLDFPCWIVLVIINQSLYYSVRIRAINDSTAALESQLIVRCLGRHEFRLSEETEFRLSEETQDFCHILKFSSVSFPSLVCHCLSGVTIYLYIVL